MRVAFIYLAKVSELLTSALRACNTAPKQARMNNL
jgi:hypothetical protein